MNSYPDEASLSSFPTSPSLPPLSIIPGLLHKRGRVPRLVNKKGCATLFLYLRSEREKNGRLRRIKRKGQEHKFDENHNGMIYVNGMKNK